MWHVGIDLHRLSVVIAAVDDEGNSFGARRINCQDRKAILETMRSLQPFRAVIEATGTYRWLYELLTPLGTVLLAHPLRLRAMVQRRSKTDKLDSQLLANLLRINQIPLAYIPPEHYQQLRDVTRHRARLSRQASAAKTQLRSLLARHNLVAPYKSVCGVRGCRWLAKQDFGAMDNLVRDELLLRLEHYRRQLAIIDARLEELRGQVPQVEALLDIHGVGLYTALLVVGELGEVERFRTARQVGSYAGLTPRVRQSGDHCYRGAITRRIPLAALDSRGSGNPSHSEGSRTEKLLPTNPQTLGSEESPRCGGPQVGGNLLEAADRLEWPPRDLRCLIEIGRKCASCGECDPLSGLARDDRRCGSDWVLHRLEKHNVRRPTSRTARMGDYLMRILQSWTTITNQSLAMDKIGGRRRAGPSLPALHPG